jgi:hypothetical protein
MNGEGGIDAAADVPNLREKFHVTNSCCTKTGIPYRI